MLNYKDMNKSLSELEQIVMNIVWDFEKCSIRDVYLKLNTKKKLAYTTVATLLKRLFEKGLVTCDSDNLALIYSPRISKESYSGKVAKLITKSFFRSFGDIAIASFAESIDKLPKKKKVYFLKLLSKKNENK